MNRRLGPGALAGALSVLALTARAEESWIQRSNAHAMKALEIQVKYAPEFAAQLGVEGYDEEIFDLRPRFRERAREDSKALAAELRTALASERDPRVRQDLEILIQAVEDQIHSSELDQQHMLPYFNLAQSLFFGVQAILDEQTAAERRPAVVARLRRYAGIEEGYEPIVALARARIEEGLADPDLVGPYVAELEQHQQNLEAISRPYMPNYASAD